MKTIHSIKVVMEATSNPLKKELAKAKKDTTTQTKAINAEITKTLKQIESAQKPIKDTANTIQSYTQKVRGFIEQAQLDAGVKTYTDDFQELHRNLQLTEKSLAELEKRAKSFSDSDKFKMSEEFKEVQAHIKDAEKRLEVLKAKKREWDSDELDWSGFDEYKEVQKQIKETTDEIKYLKGELDEMKSDGTDKVETQKWKNIQDSIRQATAEKQKYQNAMRTQFANGTHTEPSTKGFSSGSYIGAGVEVAKRIPAEASRAFASAQSGVIAFKNRIAETIKKIPLIGRLVTESAYLAKKGFGLIAFAASKIGNGIRRAGGAFAALIKRFASGLPIIRRFTGAAKQAGMQGRGLGGIFRTIGMTAKFMFSSFVIMGSIRAITDGFKNLSQYSQETNEDLSMLKSNLTTLKNSLTTAFAPILSVVAPILSTFIDWLTSATTAFAHFVAAITGKSQVVVARKVNQDFADGIEDTGSAASGATDEVEKYKRSLMGFDQINKLDDSSSSGSGGSGGTTGGLSPSDMFETVEVGSTFSDWAEKFKEAWENADFTEIGKTLGSKLNDALSNINWDSIKTTSGKIAKSIATFLNGFIKETDWELVGKTLAEGLNTVITFAYTFVTTFDWNKFGKAIGDTINGLFENTDFSKAGKTVSEALKGILDSAIKVITTTDWKTVGEKIVEFFANIDYASIATKLITGLVEAVKGLADLAIGIVNAISEKLTSYIESGNLWSDIFGAIKLTLKLTASIAGKAWELLTTIIDKGTSIGVSLVKSGWETLTKFVGNAVTAAVALAKSGWKTLSGFIGSKVTAAVALAKSGWSKLSKFVGTSVKVGIKLAKSGWSSITNWLGIAKDFLLKFKLPKIKVTWGTKEVLGFKISYPNGFETYATGGFPEEGPFMMNRGEIAGKFSNGKNVVANNQQITDGIANAVGPAVYNAVLAAISQGNGGRAEVVFRIECDSKGLFKVVKDEADKYKRTTGEPAFE